MYEERNKSFIFAGKPKRKNNFEGPDIDGE
jgi:hypothetical protein